MTNGRMLEIKNLHVQRAAASEILQGHRPDASNAGEVHAIMGPNGSGKSTLAHVLAGPPGLRGHRRRGRSTRARTCSRWIPEERAREGVFLAFQYPVEIPGVSNAYFLKAALNAMRKHRGQPELDAMEFLQLVQGEDEAARDRPEPARAAPVNEGFSGGEKKRNEIFQMARARAEARDPRRDRLGPRHRRAARSSPNGVNAHARARSARSSSSRTTSGCSNYIVPDFVHVLSDGRIVQVRRQGAGARARGEGLRLDRSRRRRRRRARERDRRRMSRRSQPGPRTSRQFDALAARPRGDASPRWLARAARARACDASRALGFPTTRDEEWRFTSVAPIADDGVRAGRPDASAPPSGSRAFASAGAAAAARRSSTAASRRRCRARRAARRACRSASLAAALTRPRRRRRAATSASSPTSRPARSPR